MTCIDMQMSMTCKKYSSCYATLIIYTTYWCSLHKNYKQLQYKSCAFHPISSNSCKSVHSSQHLSKCAGHGYQWARNSPKSLLYVGLSVPGLHSEGLQWEEIWCLWHNPFDRKKALAWHNASCRCSRT